MSLFRVFAVVLLTTLVTACSGLLRSDGSNPASVLIQKSIWVGTYDTQPVVRPVDGKISALYADSKGQIQFLQNGKQTPLSLQTDGDGLRFLKMEVQGNSVWASWWTHANGKKIFVAESQDGGKTFSPRLIATPKDTQPLPPYAVIPSTATQPAALIYSDERDGPYHIYINDFDSRTGKWHETDRQLDQGPLTMNPSGVQAAALSNTVLRKGSAVLLAWITKIQTAEGPEYRLLVRASQDNGVTWGNVTQITQSSEQIFNLIGTPAEDGKAFVFSYQQGNKGIQIASTQDLGATWKIGKALPDSGLNTNSGNVIAAGRGSSNGLIFMSWIAQKPLGKPWIMAATFDLKTQSWVSGQTQLDIKQFENTMSVMPSIAVNGKGAALVAWVDYRNILPNIYLSGTTDGGKTWSKPQNAEIDAQTSDVVVSVSADENDFLVSYDVFPDDTHKTMDLQVLRLSEEGNNSFGPLPQQHPLTDAEKEKKLRERVSTFWQDRLEGHADKNYSFFDPAFRAMNDQESFNKVQGYYKYFSYSIKSLKMEGNVAKVEVNMDFDIPETKVFGHTVKQQRRQAVGDETWLWIKDNWYFQYTNPMTGPLLSY